MKLCDRDDILNWLNQQLPPKRVKHILRVEQMAQDLALSHNVNSALTARAALLHDVAKCYSPQRLLSIAQKNLIELHPLELLNPHLLHGPVGALEARRLLQLTINKLCRRFTITPWGNRKWMR
ncbi:MAG: HD domain-containing protein [Acaryochloridaceae cyanobacterium RL_2_7]|nr:HD domain-containing protein [Acaryochloridaceae cyanobacterium RL_2_7]